MNRKLRKLIILYIFIFLIVGASSQEKVLRGKVTIKEEIPVIGAGIQVKSSGEVFYTDSLGQFKITCGNSDKLIVEAKGFNREKISVKPATKYAFINLSPKAGEKNVDLALGYINVNDKDKLYAIVGRDDTELNYSMYQNVVEALTGNFPGLQIWNNKIIIRNSVTFTDSNAALIIVDGRETTFESLSNIATVDIKNISVMKDASASIYGSRGGNGVVIVETKRGSDE